jgi:hypothetical protein
VSFCDGPPREAGKPARDPDAAAHDTRRSPSPSAPPRAIRLPPVAPRLGAPTGVAKANAAACDPISSRGLVPRCAPRARATTKPERVYLEELAGFWPRDRQISRQIVGSIGACFPESEETRV